nr:uncharacterized protein LOC106686509 isoform X2 [Halyomorpha halys]XP_014285348.1 uncharacterized protein LOC106686509 isoform X2 [Halyomorpha halys]XP_014285349.1 uncharacterized protein LOC106686509 isoform X2 [Halyomorpha halys]
MVPDLLNVSQVSKLWNFVSCHDLLWKRVSLKNCYLTDYDGLFKKMLKHRTQELVIEDTALFIPDGMSPNVFWRKIFKRIKKIITLKKIKLHNCPINSVLKISIAAPQLKSFSSSHLFRGKVNLAPLTLMNNLEELNLKGADSPIYLTSVHSMQNLISLRSLSMKKIRNLSEVVSFLPIELSSLDLSWLYKDHYASGRHKNHKMNLSSLSKLVNLKNLCLSNEAKLSISLINTTFLKFLNKIECLKLDKIYSEDLLDHLPPGLKSLTFDWNAFQLDLKFLLKLLFLSALTVKNYNAHISLMNVCSFYSLKHLTSLTFKGVNNLKELEDCLPSSLKFLKLGDCYSLSSNFTTNTIPTLINLNRLELENGLSRFQTNDLLNVIAVMPNVTHLSLINMDITSGFRESLSRCTYLQSLHISPYCSHDLDSLSVHQRIIYSVDTLKDSLKSFNLGFDCRFLDVPNCIDDQMVQVLTWNRPTREDDISISFVNTECSCVQPCPYLLHIIMVPIDVIEKELFPECLPKTKAWITKSGLLGIYPDGKRGCVSGGDYSEKFKVVRLSFYHEFYTFCKYW